MNTVYKCPKCKHTSNKLQYYEKYEENVLREKWSQIDEHENDIEYTIEEDSTDLNAGSHCSEIEYSCLKCEYSSSDLDDFENEDYYD